MSLFFPSSREAGGAGGALRFIDRRGSGARLSRFCGGSFVLTGGFLRDLLDRDLSRLVCGLRDLWLDGGLLVGVLLLSFLRRFASLGDSSELDEVWDDDDEDEDDELEDGSRVRFLTHDLWFRCLASAILCDFWANRILDGMLRSGVDGGFGRHGGSRELPVLS